MINANNTGNQSALFTKISLECHKICRHDQKRNNGKVKIKIPKASQCFLSGDSTPCVSSLHVHTSCVPPPHGVDEPLGERLRDFNPLTMKDLPQIPQVVNGLTSPHTTVMVTSISATSCFHTKSKLRQTGNKIVLRLFSAKKILT